MRSRKNKPPLERRFPVIADESMLDVNQVVQTPDSPKGPSVESRWYVKVWCFFNSVKKHPFKVLLRSCVIVLVRFTFDSPVSVSFSVSHQTRPNVYGRLEAPLSRSVFFSQCFECKQIDTWKDSNRMNSILPVQFPVLAGVLQFKKVLK